MSAQIGSGMNLATSVPRKNFVCRPWNICIYIGLCIEMWRMRMGRWGFPESCTSMAGGFMSWKLTPIYCKDYPSLYTGGIYDDDWRYPHDHDLGNPLIIWHLADLVVFLQLRFWYRDLGKGTVCPSKYLKKMGYRIHIIHCDLGLLGTFTHFLMATGKF